MSETKTTAFRVDGMHCDGCASKIRDAVRRVEGVSDASVSHRDGRATVTADPGVDRAKIIAAVASAGDYTATVAEPPAFGTEPDGASVRPEGATERSDTAEPPESLYPLFLIVGYIAGTVALAAVATGDWSMATLMRHFMAGFFLVFSFFKLLDLRGFVTAYRGYDLIAISVPAWAWAYPFVELGLGVAYLLDLVPVVTNVVTLIVMSVGAAGVLKALLNKRRIRCACLGTALNLPMTTVTLVEDLTMAAMAAAMLLMMVL